jgi:hypothetical protein
MGVRVKFKPAPIPDNRICVRQAGRRMPEREAMPTKQTSTTQEVPTSFEVEDGSTFVQGAEIDTITASGETIAAGWQGTSQTLGAYLQAFALWLGILATATRDEHGFPSWSKSDWPESARKVYDSIIAAAGLSESEEKDLTTSVRARWSRSTGPGNVRDSFVVRFVLDNYAGAKVLTYSTPTDPMIRDHRAAVALLGDAASMLPEEMREDPWIPQSVNAPAKRGIAEQLGHFKLTVPERLGGAPKATADKPKMPASVQSDLEGIANDAISGHVGTEGGSSFESVAVGLYAALSAYAAEVTTASEIGNRGEVREIVGKCEEILGLTGKTLDSKATAEDAERLAAISYVKQ